MNKINLKNIYSKYVHRDRSKLYLTPYREWGIILIFGVPLLIAVSMFGYYTYERYFVTGVEEVSPVAVTTKKSDIEILKKDLDDTLDYFKNKEEKHTNLLLEQGHPRSILPATTTQGMLGNATASTSTTTSTR